LKRNIAVTNHCRLENTARQAEGVRKVRRAVKSCGRPNGAKPLSISARLENDVDVLLSERTACFGASRPVSRGLGKPFLRAGIKRPGPGQFNAANASNGRSSCCRNCRSREQNRPDAPWPHTGSDGKQVSKVVSPSPSTGSTMSVKAMRITRILHQYCCGTSARFRAASSRSWSKQHPSEFSAQRWQRARMGFLRSRLPGNTSLGEGAGGVLGRQVLNNML
jgi:hypothetical protein